MSVHAFVWKRLITNVLIVTFSIGSSAFHSFSSWLVPFLSLSKIGRVGKIPLRLPCVSNQNRLDRSSLSPLAASSWTIQPLLITTAVCTFQSSPLCLTPPSNSFISSYFFFFLFLSLSFVSTLLQESNEFGKTPFSIVVWPALRFAESLYRDRGAFKSRCSPQPRGGEGCSCTSEKSGRRLFDPLVFRLRFVSSISSLPNDVVPFARSNEQIPPCPPIVSSPGLSSVSVRG